MDKLFEVIIEHPVISEREKNVHERSVNNKIDSYVNHGCKFISRKTEPCDFEGFNGLRTIITFEKEANL